LQPCVKNITEQAKKIFLSKPILITANT